MKGFIEAKRRTGSGLRVAVRAIDVVMFSENHDKTAVLTLSNREVVCVDLTYDDVVAQMSPDYADLQDPHGEEIPF